MRGRPIVSSVVTRRLLLNGFEVVDDAKEPANGLGTLLLVCEQGFGDGKFDQTLQGRLVTVRRQSRYDGCLLAGCVASVGAKILVSQRKDALLQNLELHQNLKPFPMANSSSAGRRTLT